MPRIRTIKPEFFRSPSTAQCSYKARILYQAMWCWADDWGIGETNVYGLLGFAFPDSDRITAEELPRLLKEIQSAYEVAFYECRGRYFYAIPSWDSHQKTERRAAKRNPTSDDPDSRPDLRFETDAEVPWQNHGNSEQTQGKTPVGTGEQGTGEQGTGENSSLTLVEGGPGGDPQNLPVAAKAAPADTRGKRLPENWRPSDETIAAMREQFPHVDLKAVHEEFIDYWRAIPGAKGRKLDWDGTWRNRVREIASRQRAPTRNGHNGAGGSQLQGADLRAAENEAFKRLNPQQELG
jgi:hypothetical protein